MTRVMPQFKKLIEEGISRNDISISQMEEVVKRTTDDVSIQKMNLYYRKILTSVDEKHQNKCINNLLKHVFSPADDSEATLHVFSQHLWLYNKTRSALLEEWQEINWPAAEEARMQFEGIQAQNINEFDNLIDQARQDVNEFKRHKALAVEWDLKRADFQNRWQALEPWATEQQTDNFNKNISTENYLNQDESSLVLEVLITSVTQKRTAALTSYRAAKEQLKADTNALSSKIMEVDDLRKELRASQREGIAAPLNVDHLEKAREILEQANSQYETKLEPHEITPSRIEAAKADITQTRENINQNLQILNTDLQRTQKLQSEDKQRKIVKASYQTLNSILNTLLNEASKRLERYGNFFKKTKAKKQWTYTFITAVEQYQRKLVFNNNAPLEAPKIDAMKTELSNLITKFKEATERRWVFFLPGVGSTTQGEKDYIEKCQAELEKISKGVTQVPIQRPLI